MSRHSQNHGFGSLDDHSFAGFADDEILEVANPGGGSTVRSTGIATADVSDAVAKRHDQNTDQSLDLGGGNQVDAPDLRNLVDNITITQPVDLDALESASHAQDTDQFLDFGGPNQVAASDLAPLVGHLSADPAHAGSAISFTPTATILANRVEAAINEVDAEHVAKSAVIINGNLLAMNGSGDGVDSGLGFAVGDGWLNKAPVAAPATLNLDDWGIEDLGGGRFQMVFESAGGPVVAPFDPRAQDIEFTPAVLADWTGSVDPGDTNDALDQLAARLTIAEGLLSGFETRTVVGLPIPFGRNNSIGGDQWMRMYPNGVPANQAPVRIEFDATIVGISVTAGSPVGADVDFEVYGEADSRSGGIPVDGNKLAEFVLGTGNDGGGTMALSVDINAGEHIGVYARGSVSFPGGVVWVRPR